jgi:hypothetical protein
MPAMAGFLYFHVETDASHEAVSPDFTDNELNLLARAFHQALVRLNGSSHGPEEFKAVLLTGILNAADDGERDEDKLVQSAFRALEEFERDSLG